MLQHNLRLSPKALELISLAFAFVFVPQSQEEVSILNNVLRGFANTTRKLLKNKIKGSFAADLQTQQKQGEGNEVECLVWMLNAFASSPTLASVQNAIIHLIFSGCFASFQLLRARSDFGW